MVTDLNCEYLGLSRLCLMESAGKSLAEEIGKIAVYTFSKPVKIIIFAGSGGNAGDAFVATRYLLNKGYDVDIYMLTQENKIKSNDAKSNFKILENLKPRLSHLKIYNLATVEDINSCELVNSDEFSDFIIIDAILGTGIKGKLRDKVRRAIEVINESKGLKISVDIPSGMNALTGKIEDLAVKPDYTISFHKIKTGVRISDEEKVGGLVTADIGIPFEAEYFINYGDMIKLNKRSNKSHKGNNGKVLVIGGSKDYFGAPAISGMAAISSGVDLVYIVAPESASMAIKSFSPDLIVKSLEGDYLSLKHLDEILKLSNSVDAVLIGPGASINDETAKLFNVLITKIKKPIVLDADALKQVEISLIKDRKDIILTPHLSEFKSLFKVKNDLKLDIDTYDFNKVDENITEFQKITNSIDASVIVKGKYDLILFKNKFKINKTGNPGMTVGGTGDALAGISVSLFAQGLNSFDASSLASFINGLAGDKAYEDKGYAFSASDLISNIGFVIKDGLY